MDLGSPAVQQYNGGIIFVSYIIAVVGAMTTLELLIRRTHIRGLYNWLLLFFAAASMGGVGIWSMHFIGNNSLSITFDDGQVYQLSYSAGFTFASLIVAIVTMLLAFVFVGITEEAKLIRIIPSGIIAGGGICVMHYLGQFAIDFFILKNKIPYVIGAVIIAVCAVTAALFIFFKLREQWANQWYKRVGCALLMGVAVCGMHYTALVGTVYYKGESTNGPPNPVLRTPALIGIISAIVVVACMILCVIAAKAKIRDVTLFFEKKHKRLILDIVFFDTNGRVLVKTDGILPMKEILEKLPEGDDSSQEFSTSHRLFKTLFDLAIQWSTPSNLNDDGQLLNTLGHNPIESTFISAANELIDELHLSTFLDLGILFDSVLTTNTIAQKSVFSQVHQTQKNSTIRRSSSTASRLLGGRFIKDNAEEEAEMKNRGSPAKQNRQSRTEDATVIDIFNDVEDNDSFSNTGRLSVSDSHTEDKHIFLVKKIESNRSLVNLLSIGFRFADPLFISKTMGDKLKVPSDYMLNHFRDMLQMSETACTLYHPLRPTSDYSSFYKPTETSQDARGGIFIGIFALVDDRSAPSKMPFIITDKKKRYCFPMTQLIYEGDTEEERKPLNLTRQEKNYILSLSGQTLVNFASSNPYKGTTSDTNSGTDSITTELENVFESSSIKTTKSNGVTNNMLDALVDIKTKTEANSRIQRFTKALEIAAKKLINSSSYGRPLASSARLYSDVIDIPAFTLRTGPCQLVIFKAYITTPGTRFAINQTLTETIKCVPFPLYRSFAYYTTDNAMEEYKKAQNKQSSSSSTYLVQQQLYLSSAGHKNDKHSLLKIEQKPSEELEGGTQDDENASVSYQSTHSNQSKPTNPSVELGPALQTLASLPPPPRAKRNKFTLPGGISSLDIGNFNKEVLPKMMKSQMSKFDSGHSTPVELPIVLNLLPVDDRFWWLNGLYEETLHSER
ncbi:hypothetical protein K501DRAFT_192481 [Backusella circina FSU 941]|nr:hypothetical protein K501DRAFT_192481 [Backusella circina FSU 941]